MKKIVVCVLVLALFGWLSVTTAPAGPKTDHALLNGPGADTSVQCGATKIEKPGGVITYKPTSFTVHITMSNIGVNGFVRVTYQDTDFVDYAIPAGTTVQISLAGGGTVGVDQIITVTNGGSGAVLVGQISIITDDGAKPHPALDPINYCTTSP